MARISWWSRLMSLLTRRAGTPSVTPTISISPNDDTVSVAQGATTAIIYTLTRGGNYAGTVTPAVTGLPTGVTGGWSDSSLTGADSTTTLTLTAAADASIVTDDAFTVTFTGSGVTEATDSGTVSVTSPEATEWMPNKPSGMTQYGSTFFAPGDVAVYPDSSGAAGLFAADFEDYGDTMQATVTGQPSGHGDGAWEIYHEGNSTGDGYGPGNMFETTERNYTRLYFALSAFFPTDYRCHTGGEKFTYFRAKTNGVDTRSVSMGILCARNYDLRPDVIASTLAHTLEPCVTDFWIPGHPIHGPGYTKPWNLTSVRIPRGEWCQIEVDTKMNTPGNSDGEVKLWVNGSLHEHETGICFHYSDEGTLTESIYQTTINALRFDFTRGGGASAIATASGGQSWYMGRLEWWGIV